MNHDEDPRQPTHEQRMEGSRIINWLDEQEDGLITQLRGYVDTNSGLDNPTGRGEILDDLQKRYEQLGFVCRRLRHEQGFVHLIAARPSTKPDATKVMLLGHVDTVFNSDSVFLTFQREGDWASGPGVGDMKGGLVVTQALLGGLKQVGRLGDFDWVVVHNSDEEIGSPTSREVIERLAADRDVCLGFEIGRKSGAVVRSRAGVGAFFINVRGRAAHAGMDPHLGASAIVSAAELAQRIAALANPSLQTSVNIGKITGGERRNIVPDACKLEVDVRVRSADEATRVEQALRAACEELVVPGTTAEVFGHMSRPPWQRTPASDRLVHHFQDVARDLGVTLEAEDTGGGADTNFAGSMGIPTIDALGPVGQGAHTHDERIKLHSLITRAKLCAIALLRWEKADRAEA
ncbi:MAG: M20 family metallopeptidase [Myxococcales bacterium]|nr:M20 family metallopeptidase [Myxococcales bacterium]